MRPLTALPPRRCDPKTAQGWWRCARWTRCQPSVVTRVDHGGWKQRTQEVTWVWLGSPQWTCRTNDDKCFSARRAGLTQTLRIRWSPKTPVDPKSGSLSCQQVRFDDCGTSLRPISKGDRSAADSALIPGGCHRLGRSRGMTVVTAGDELLVIVPEGTPTRGSASDGGHSREISKAPPRGAVPRMTTRTREYLWYETTRATNLLAR